MWWLIQNIIFSVCLIVIIHYLYIYFETTLTSPKVKDLIHGPKQEYKSLLESIHKKGDTMCDIPVYNPSIITNSNANPDANANVTNLGINTNSDDMKSDLKDYLRGIASKSKVAIQNTNN
jgi:hypothetical protein